MKTLRPFAIIIFSTFLFACNSAPTENTTEEVSTEANSTAEESDLSGMEEVDLSEYELSATIFVPDESKGKREIGFTEAGNIQIIVGKRFGIELVPYGLTVAEKKEELTGDLVYNVEFIEDTEKAIIYSKTIKDSDIEAENHFFYSFESEGELIEIKNVEGMSFSLSMIEKMMASAKSIKAKANA